MRPDPHLSVLGPGGANDALQPAGVLQGEFWSVRLELSLIPTLGIGPSWVPKRKTLFLL